MLSSVCFCVALTATFIAGQSVVIEALPESRLIADITLAGQPAGLNFSTAVVGQVKLNLGQEIGVPLSPITEFTIEDASVGLVDIETTLPVLTFGVLTILVQDAAVEVRADTIFVNPDGTFDTSNVEIRFRSGFVRYSSTGLLEQLVGSGEFFLDPNSFFDNGQGDLGSITVSEGPSPGRQTIDFVFPFVPNPYIPGLPEVGLKLDTVFSGQLVIPEASPLLLLLSCLPAWLATFAWTRRRMLTK